MGKRGPVLLFLFPGIICITFIRTNEMCFTMRRHLKYLKTEFRRWDYN